ncbi:MAG: dockerin type I repeat-containing protein [Muribaculaceae bacterium]|nr:dockerin type I repeat-containing protein [Muribaculaceae bacterium]
MKKILLSLMALMAILPASADNYFTLRADSAISAVNDTLWFHPKFAGNTLDFHALAHFDGYLDHWYLKMTHPKNIKIDNSVTPIIEEEEGMDVPYINSYGDSAVYHALLLTRSPNNDVVTAYESYFSSTITGFGYWDPYNNGNYLCYGTVKWGPDTQDPMFTFKFKLPSGLMDADIILDAALTSTDDWRGVPTVNMNPCVKTVHIHLGYQRGDVSGDWVLSMSDVVMLIDHINGIAQLDAYQLAAADVDGDGYITIADVIDLQDLILV